jgi:hypothetical protein
MDKTIAWIKCEREFGIGLSPLVAILDGCLRAAMRGATFHFLIFGRGKGSGAQHPAAQGRRAGANGVQTRKTLRIILDIPRLEVFQQHRQLMADGQEWPSYN